jgi:hypothetical protein
MAFRFRRRADSIFEYDRGTTTENSEDPSIMIDKGRKEKPWNFRLNESVSFWNKGEDQRWPH